VAFFVVFLGVYAYILPKYLTYKRTELIVGLRNINYRQVAVNAATDAGVCFNAGSIPVSIQHSWEAAAINAGVASMSFATRFAVEMKKSAEEAGGEFNSQNAASKMFHRFASNRGAGLITSGALTLTAGGFAAAEALTNNPEAASTAGMLTCFGLVHTFRGVATGMKDSIKKYALDSVAFVSAVSAYIIANPDLPDAVKLAYGGVAALSTYMAIRGQKADGAKQPDLYFALTSYASAAFSAEENINVAMGFVGWATGYLSLDAMRKKGGVWQAVTSIGSKKNAVPPSSPDGPNIDGMP